MRKCLLSLMVCMFLFSLHVNCRKNVEQNGSFTNPLFAGDYPDPSILRDGKDFYIVHSSFEYYPGLLIWHSTDLLNWEPVTNALNTYVGSVWAPELIKYDDKYYIYFPASGTNYVIWADKIEGPWSEPIHIDITMIDPGHITDDKGNRYLYFSSGSYVPLSKDGLIVTGDVEHVYDGWKIPRDWSIECFCMEGPKLVKHGEYYYLTVAEGGTAGPATGHMVISARSKSPTGPWENSPHNPILRATSTADHWRSVGHGTIFDDIDGNWYMIFHGYENGFYTMGRQTLITPIEWTEDGWYTIPDDVAIAKPIHIPAFRNSTRTPYELSDSFDGSDLNLQWKFFEGSKKERYTLKNGSIAINGKGTSVADCSPLLTIPSDHSYTTDVELEIENDAVGGIVLFYNKAAFSGILADSNNVLTNLRGWQFATEKEVLNRHVYLRLKNSNHIVDMYYSLDGKKWMKTENSFDASGYHHNVLSGFMSLRIGLCSIGEGTVHFKNFTYTPAE